jgi:hypothetical protein
MIHPHITRRPQSHGQWRLVEAGGCRRILGKLPE